MYMSNVCNSSKEKSHKTKILELDSDKYRANLYK
jgi:hypothetical protein